MSIVDPEVRATAVEFWESVGVPHYFPRLLEPGVFLAFPLAVVRLPRLRQSSAGAWLAQRRIPHTGASHDEPLHGYLVARGGAGVAFLDGADPPDEQRFSLAHEFAHFLNDYWRPRANALRACGAGIQEVLDGRRPPTPEERLAGIIRGVPLGEYFHVGRPSQGACEVLQMEDRADQLALEILAPISSVIGLLRSRLGTSFADDSQNVVAALLCEHYGLPPMIADIYARTVLSTVRSRQSIRQWLGA